MIGTANPLIDRMRVYDPQVDSDRLERAFELGKTLTLFFFLSSASELPPPAFLAAPERAGWGRPVLAWLAKYSHVWYIYCFLKMACDANSTVLAHRLLVAQVELAGARGLAHVDVEPPPAHGALL